MERLTRELESIRRDAAAIGAAVRLAEMALPADIAAEVDPAELRQRLDNAAVVIDALAERIELAAQGLAVELRGASPPAV